MSIFKGIIMVSQWADKAIILGKQTCGIERQAFGLDNHHIGG
jgi:hypothetical protein